MPSITINTLISQAKEILAPHTNEPLLEAEILLAYVLKQSRSYLRAWPEKILTEHEKKEVNHLITRRSIGEPIAYIIGHREFWSLDLSVNSNTLIPRPDTELIVELAVGIIKSEQIENIADLGTGSGAIALAIANECKEVMISAVDISEDALKVASYNAKNLGMTNVTFYQGNWCEALPSKKFDMIISNPPYLSDDEWASSTSSFLLSFEPPLALKAGEDGLAAIRDIAAQAKFYLKSGGYLLLEHGNLQAESVHHLLSFNHYANIKTLKDLSGHDRVTIARYF